MTDTELPAELAALVDLGPIESVEAEIAEAKRRHDDALAALRDAEAEVVIARRALPNLTDAAVSGTSVSLATHARVTRKIEDAERYAGFCREVARRLEPDPREAAARMACAKAEAYAALLARGVDLRIAAAARADRADGTVNRNMDHAEMHAAKRDYEAASRIVHFAIRNGARFPGSTPQAIGLAMPSWPSSEFHERGYWGREEVTQEAA